MNGGQWIEFAGLLLAETTAVVLLAAAAARFRRDPRARAVFWQASFLALGVTLVLRLSNLEIAAVRPGAARSVEAKVMEPAEEPAPLVPSFAPKTGLAERNEIRWPIWLWLAGTALLLARTVQARWRLRQALKRVEPASPEIAAIVETLRARIGAPTIATAIWNELPAPCVSGIWRPILALPCKIEARVAPKQLEAMLAHEIAHVAARDPFWALASELVAALLWWHPAAWFARRALLNASELAADQASHCLPQGPTALAESLVILGRELSDRTPRTLPVLGGGGLRSGLGRRVEALLQNSASWAPVRPGRAWLWRACALLGIIALAAPLPHAQPPAPIWTWLAAPAVIAAAEPVPGATNTSPASTVSEIMTDPQFREVIRALENSRQGATLPSAALPPPTATIDSNKAVTLRFQIAEISEQTPTIGLDWLFGKVREKEPVRLSATAPYRIPGNEPLTSTNIQVEHLRLEEQFAVLNSDQFRELLAALERQPGVDLLSAPMVTTRSGRQARISVMEVQTLVTGDSVSIGGTNTAPTERVNFGVVVDVTPAAVGDSWVLPVVASYVEFLGYDTDKKSRKPAPRPRIRVRDATATATASLGETLVIRGVPVTSRLVEPGFFRRDKIKEVRKRIYMFVTPKQPKN